MQTVTDTGLQYTLNATATLAATTVGVPGTSYISNGDFELQMPVVANLDEGTAIELIQASGNGIISQFTSQFGLDGTERNYTSVPVLSGTSRIAYLAKIFGRKTWVLLPTYITTGQTPVIEKQTVPNDGITTVPTGYVVGFLDGIYRLYESDDTVAGIHVGPDAAPGEPITLVSEGIVVARINQQLRKGSPLRPAPQGLLVFRKPGARKPVMAFLMQNSNIGLARIKLINPYVPVKREIILDVDAPLDGSVDSELNLLLDKGINGRFIWKGSPIYILEAYAKLQTPASSTVLINLETGLGKLIRPQRYISMYYLFQQWISPSFDADRYGPTPATRNTGSIFSWFTIEDTDELAGDIFKFSDANNTYELIAGTDFAISTYVSTTGETLEEVMLIRATETNDNLFVAMQATAFTSYFFKRIGNTIAILSFPFQFGVEISVRTSTNKASLAADAVQGDGVVNPGREIRIADGTEADLGGAGLTVKLVYEEKAIMI